MKLITRKKTYDLSQRTYIMGILNVTPDSFSDGGKYTSIDRAVKQAVLMEEQGADFIDIGGESTRPDHDPVSVQEELERVLPIIEAVNKEVSIPISIDTYKAETAKHALEAGADIINDIWGAKHDEQMAQVAADYEAPIILMHNRSNKDYKNLILDMMTDLKASIGIVKKAGVSDDKIILDPGIGFAKTLDQNYEVMNQLEAFQSLGYPILLATSRKSFITKVLDVPPIERDYATGATTCLGIQKGANIIRVHHVKLNVEMAKMMDAMLRGV